MRWSRSPCPCGGDACDATLLVGGLPLYQLSVLHIRPMLGTTCGGLAILCAASIVVRIRDLGLGCLLLPVLGNPTMLIWPSRCAKPKEGYTLSLLKEAALLGSHAHISSRLLLISCTCMV